MPEEQEARIYTPTTTLAQLGVKLRTGLIPAPGVATLSNLSVKPNGPLAKGTPIMVIGQRLRDDWWQKFPVLPALVSSFSQIATSREWTVTGRPRVASRAVDRLNSVVYVDWYGQVFEGWSAFTGRRIVDWLMLGVNGMFVPNDKAPIQYVDPLEVQHSPKEKHRRIITGKNVPEWQDFLYMDKRWSHKQLFLNYYLPYGFTGAVMAPLIPAIPLARLLYLVQQHDMASIDGRKVKDIFLVADDNIADSLEQALQLYADMQSGTPDPEKHGIPIVALNKRGGISEGETVEDFISLLGISKVPDGMDRDVLYDNAAIEFSALTGMQVTEWWHIKSGANNRATERVNQERGRTKGPNYYCRQDQRIINNSRVLGRAHFAYVEEVDIQAQKDRAEVMLRLSEAVKNLREAIGMAISPRSMVRWLQQLGVFPTDDYLIDDILLLNEDPVKPADMVDVPIEVLLEEQERADRERVAEREMEEAELAAEKQRLLIEAQQAATSDNDEREDAAQRSILRFIREVEHARSTQVRPVPEYGDVILNREGLVLEYRRPVYPIAKILAQDVQDDTVESQQAEQDLQSVIDHVANTVNGDLTDPEVVDSI